MSYLATTCTPAEIDAVIAAKLSDSSNNYWSSAEVTAARNTAILGLYPQFRLKATDVTLSTSVSTNIYDLPAEITAVGDDCIVAMDIANVIKTDWTVWNGKLMTPRLGNWGVAGKTIRIYYTKPFTSPPSTTLDVPPILQPLVTLRACIELVDKKLIEANKELSAHWYSLKRQWISEAEKLAADIESNQKYFTVAGEMQFDGGHAG
jgi:hypothetical protein